jgi:hypothetical protein
MLIPNKIREVINIKNGIQEALGGHDVLGSQGISISHSCIPLHSQTKALTTRLQTRNSMAIKKNNVDIAGPFFVMLFSKSDKLFLKLPPMSTNILNKEILLNL